MPPPSAAAPPALQEATRHATGTWQDDLKALFDHAKDRFPDVVWELLNEHDSNAKGAEEVWGHKAVVYARAPPSFQARYFSFKPAPLPASPLPYSSSPTGTLPAQSALSLTLGVDFTSVSRSPSPFRAPSPAPSASTGAVLRIPIAINPILFCNELEYLYTGKGFGEAFEFLFDSTASPEEGNDEDARIDKLRKDLVFMWRSRLYSDIRISLTGIFSSTNHEPTTAIFSSHRFMLVSRSAYFRTQLLDWADSLKASGEPFTVTLPSPPFTPASLHFTLGFIYTGTLAFSNRTFDLDTSFHIMRSASYLSIDTLYDEIQARIVQEMMHGLFHAFLEFSEYEAATGGKWGSGGCRCRQCARRAPRVLEFALSDDVKNPHLERGARRALVGLFGEGWCTSEFANLPQKTRDAIVKGLAKRTTPMNIFPLLFASHAALARLGTIIDNWSDTIKDMVLAGRKTIDEVMCSQADQCFEQPEWLDIMESDGVRFEDGERVEWAMESIRRGLNEKNAAALYQTLVSAVLLRPHPTEPDQAMLSATSHVRVSVEQARMDILRWLRRRYLNVKQEGGFDCLEPWAAKEIASELELSVDDMFSPVSPSAAPRGTGRVGPRVSAAKAEDETGSMHSLRTGIPKYSTTSRGTDTVKSSNASTRSVARSTLSVTSKTSTVTTTRRLALSTGRPDSKLTPSHVTSPSSVRSGLTSNGPASSHASGRTSLSPVPGRRNVSGSLSPGDRGSRLRSSVASVKSQTSTIRKRSPARPSSLRPSSALSGRPPSTMSNTTSDVSTAFETAKTDITPVTARSRRGSTASSVSNMSVKTTGTSRTTATSTSRLPRSRAPSTASKPTTPLRKRPAPSPVDSKASPATKRTASSMSVRSTASTSPTAPRRVISRQASGAPSVRSVSTTSREVSGTVKGKGRPSVIVTHGKQASVVSTSSAATLKRKSSTETIKEAPAPQLPRGATLDIGIPCIISSKKARFRAFARYIGEVEGELGPWVGVEVPMNDTWPGEKLEGRAWHDGTWGGIRYFDIGSSSDWDYDDDRAARRRKFDWASGGKGTLKREGDQLSIDRAKRMRSVSPAVSDVSNSESRGLFVRPQQVLYVVDAVGSDL
ncbi:uncharacterized protein B0H18DRAFT_1124832 [Fomitopsis serialis]|uniref:uncharacterized protein n=1 Tax=Fomitopsis serialis TaxID=139415 RepID=UPI002007B4A6|nr:uncharacterized protein B0H18DRAFT_1124832 [Neoantrodia serialis]KAH9915626.1 hypothetical protein B0H18DRAFT_1124832 [Neoantrodia serialis]